MRDDNYVGIAIQLERSGLIWHPEIGDEVVERRPDARVSILVDPQGLTPVELRAAYVWLPTVEQLVEQIEERNGLIFHAGVSTSHDYEAVVKSSIGLIEAQARSLRTVFAKALHALISNSASGAVH